MPSALQPLSRAVLLAALVLPALARADVIVSGGKAYCCAYGATPLPQGETSRQQHTCRDVYGTVVQGELDRGQECTVSPDFPRTREPPRFRPTQFALRGIRQLSVRILGAERVDKGELVQRVPGTPARYRDPASRVEYVVRGDLIFRVSGGAEILCCGSKKAPPK